MGREQHTRRAYPALRRAALNKRLLQSRQPSAVCKALDRKDIATIDLPNGYKTTVDHLSVDQDRASAALPFSATFFRPSGTKIFSKHIEQSPRSRSFERDGASVQRKAHAAKTFSGVAGISSSQTPVAS